jgi:protein gp37
LSTRIEWTEETWNPITGCSPVSEGCQNCYARRMAYRLRGRFGYPKNDPFAVTLHHDRLGEPFRWRKPRMIFVCSMGDLMHEKVSDRSIQMVIHVMVENPRHTFQVLTKRPARLLKFAWPSNCCVGVTVELPKYLDRIDVLRQVKAPIRFVSFEPLLADMGNILDLRGIGWVIVGAETGRGKRPMDPSWARWILDVCRSQRVPFFFKRDGQGSRLLDGVKYEEMPDAH